jgi:hypothetical protein
MLVVVTQTMKEAVVIIVSYCRGRIASCPVLSRSHCIQYSSVKLTADQALCYTIALSD